ncbi:MAG: NFACT family protein [Acholeplasmataceae bacterium]|nr:NFACT family protein [Acholeplasmataceae bacterium]
MAFDGFFIFHLIKELNQNLVKARLEKIYQNDEFSFVFVFYLRGERKHLMIYLSPNRFGIHLSKHQTQNQASSQFLNTLKKNLEGAILENVTQYETDRVITLNFTVYDFIDGPVAKQLVFEAMGKHSNLLLIKDKVIIDTLKKMFFEEGRQLLPQASFEYFPTDKKSFLSIDYEKIHSPKDLVENYMGVSPFLARYLFENQVQLEAIICKPTRDLTSKRDYVFDIFESTHEKKYYDSISEMMDDQKEEKKISFLSHQLFIDKQIKKYEKKRVQYEQMLTDTEEKLKQKTYGDFIYQSGYDLNEKRSSLEFEGEIVPLDPTKTLNENAQEFFKQYQKGKRGILHIELQMKQNDDLIDLFNDFQGFLSFATTDSLKDLEKDLTPYGYKAVKTKVVHNKKHVSKPNVLRIQDEDIIYTIGKNNLQNEYITHELAKKDDYWFHVKNAPGAHVIVNRSKLDEPILRKACMLAAYFSSQRESSSIPVDYTLVKNIKKIPGLPGYKVSIKNQQTMYIDIDMDKISSYLKKV